ncbi:MAG TPA: hypothetical protein VK750_05110, partial [Cytophagaceae bacterium]|nr:hypothetical protein [Cytophagaceae bacterium]
GTGYIYNGQSFAYDPTPLATFNPKYTATNYNTTLRIRMDALGNEFLQMAYNKDNRVATNDAFKTFFKGMTLMPGTGNTCIYGYAYTPTLQLYYHDSNTPDIGQSYTFKHTPNVDLFYNRLKNDRSGTNLSPLKFAYQEIPATQTNNESYVMTGVELMSKIKFPYLNMIHSTYPNFAINRAILEIHPKPLTYNLFFKLPTDLVLYQTNYTNVPGTVISYQGTSIPQIASPHVDYESNLSTYYQFNITDFVTNQLKVNYFDEAALILTSPRSLSGNRTERLVLDNKYSSYTIILKLYVTLF